MQQFNDTTAPHQLPFEAFGIHVRICTNDPELLDRIEPMLPPNWTRRPRSAAQLRLGLLDEGNDIFTIFRQDGMCIHEAPGREYALMRMDSMIQSLVALEATDYVFVHAGVVASAGQAIVIPGLSFSGKTTLVRALVEQGALYYSDEFAVLDPAGQVHPYAKPLSLRGHMTPAVDTHVHELGGTAGVEALPVGLVVATRYQRDAEWDPEELSPGAGTLALLEHAVPAQARPSQTMRVLSRAIEGARILKGERGEAEEFAPVLLDELRAHVGS